MPNTCQSCAWFDKISKTLMTEWVSNMDPKDASASKKLLFYPRQKKSQKFQGKSIHFTRLLKLWLANSMSDLKYCSQGLSPCRQHYWKIEFYKRKFHIPGDNLSSCSTIFSELVKLPKLVSRLVLSLKDFATWWIGEDQAAATALDMLIIHSPHICKKEPKLYVRFWQ